MIKHSGSVKLTLEARQDLNSEIKKKLKLEVLTSVCSSYMVVSSPF